MINIGINIFKCAFESKSLERSFISYIHRKFDIYLKILLITYFLICVFFALGLVSINIGIEISTYPVSFVLTSMYLFGMISVYLAKPSFKFYLYRYVLIYIILTSSIIPFEKMYMTQTYLLTSTKFMIGVAYLFILNFIRYLFINVNIYIHHCLNVFSLIIFFVVAYVVHDIGFDILNSFNFLLVFIYCIGTGALFHYFSISLRRNYVHHLLIRAKIEKKDQSIKRLLKVETAYMQENKSQLMMHEIKGSIGTIQLNLELLENVINAESLKYFKRIQSATNKIIKVIKNTASLKEIQIEKLEDVSIKDMILNACDVLNIEKDEIVVNGYDRHIMCDKYLIEGAFANLIKNTREAMGKKNKIVVNIKSANSNEVLVEFESILKNNVKINESELFKIFPSSSKKNSFGIGLAYVRSVAKAHFGNAYHRLDGNIITFVVKLKVDLYK